MMQLMMQMQRVTMMESQPMITLLTLWWIRMLRPHAINARACGGTSIASIKSAIR